MRLSLKLLLFLLPLALFVGCDSDGDDDDARTATAAMASPADTTTGVSGTVTFTSTDDGVRIDADLRGLSEGDHGVHLHTTGSCELGDSDNDGVLEIAGAAGGHYDPRGTNNHGAPDDDLDDKHLGDFGNVTAGADGRATKTLEVDDLAFSSVLGRAMIVHSGRDDLETDPGGNSGTRIGCALVLAD